MQYIMGAIEDVGAILRELSCQADLDNDRPQVAAPTIRTPDNQGDDCSKDYSYPESI